MKLTALLSRVASPRFLFASWKSRLSVNTVGLDLAFVGKLKKNRYILAVHCSQVVNHSQTYHNTSTHKHNHHLTRDRSVDCSADTVRTVVADFFICSF